MKSTFTVQPSRNKKFGVFRLGLDRSLTKLVSKHQLIYLKLSSSILLQVKIVCGPPNKKAYDVNNKNLSDWIKEKGFNDYPHGKPTKLDFQLDKANWTFTFLGEKTSP